MTTPPNPAFARLASRAQHQYGLFTELQARDAGLSQAILSHRLRTGEIVTVDHHVYRNATTPLTWHQRVMAACLAGPAVASHRAAGALWTVADLHLGRREVEVTAWRHRRRKPSDITWHESYLLQDDQITEIDGIPVTNATRTVLDLAGVLDDEDTLRAFDAFARRRLTDAARVRAMLEQLGPRRPGADRVKRIVALRTAGPRNTPTVIPESDLETRFENVLRRFGLPAPSRQIGVRTGGRTLHIDFGYEAYRLGFEVLGAEFHASPEMWASDIARLAELAELDWQILLFAEEQIERRPESVAQATRHALIRAGHQFT